MKLIHACEKGRKIIGEISDITSHQLHTNVGLERGMGNAINRIHTETHGAGSISRSVYDSDKLMAHATA